IYARAWPDRASLNHYLKQHFGPDRLRQWLKQGEDQHALEGMLFSELALMVVDKKLFARHYVRIFNDASALTLTLFAESRTTLTLFAESRTTLRMFLDDCRLARNEVIARQPLTSAQLMLLNVQYQQIVRPIQRAYAEKRTRVNPASFLLADERELRQFWETARLKDRQAGGDKHEISESIEPPRKRPPRTPEEREQLISGALWGGVGVMTYCDRYDRLAS
ncbi:Putative inner membrane protein, partial [Salmonella enterica subsp. enterica serovar Montevideo str. S5-403]